MYFFTPATARAPLGYMMHTCLAAAVEPHLENGARLRVYIPDGSANLIRGDMDHVIDKAGAHSPRLVSDLPHAGAVGKESGRVNRGDFAILQGLEHGIRVFGVYSND